MSDARPERDTMQGDARHPAMQCEPSTATAIGDRHPAMQRDPSRFQPRLKRRARFGVFFHALCFAATAVGVIVLAVLLFDVVSDGTRYLSWEFLTGFPSRLAVRAGILPALVGSIWTLVLTALIAFPLGVGTAIWLEEYAPESTWKKLVETNIANLAGVPSIVYGILGLAVFVRYMMIGRSILAAALTLALLILPVVIIASQEAIKAVSNSIRLGAYALGATRWEMVRMAVLPFGRSGVISAAMRTGGTVRSAKTGRQFPARSLQ